MRAPAWFRVLLAIGLVASVACSAGDAPEATGTATPTPGDTTTATSTGSTTTSPTPTGTLFGTFTPIPTPTPSARQVQIYRNDTYGYSFSVACPPFCELDDTALDTFRAVSVDGRNAWVEARVTLLSETEGDGSLEGFHEAWKTEMTGLAEQFKETSSRATTLIDKTTPALQIEWTATSADAASSDMTATTLLAVSGPLGYALAVGSPPTQDALLREDLDLVLKTFNVEGQTANLPGTINQYGFTFNYPPTWEAAQSGLSAALPDLEQGQFRAGIRPPGPAAVVLLTWSTTTPEMFKPVDDIDQAITQAQQASDAYKTLFEGTGEVDGAEVTYFLYQDALEDGRAIFAGFGEWFCEESSRVFTMFFGTDTAVTLEQLTARYDEILGAFKCTAPEAP